MSLDDAKVKAFLKDLNELSRKHRVKIKGCGCCGSSYLAELRTEELDDIYTVAPEYYDTLELKPVEDVEDYELC